VRGDLDAVDDLVAPDFVAHGQGGMDDARGRETFREWLRWYTSAFVNREWTVHDILSEGDRTVVRCSGRATYKGGLLDIPSEDQRVLETSILILRIESGLVKEIWSEMSDLQLVMQLGAFPVPDQSR
jgi:predicted ester cyclase